MREKHSPTISAAYIKDKKWFKKYSDYDNQPVAWFIYDPEGYDQCGYDEDEIDRAGNTESAYYYLADDGTEGDCNDFYEEIANEWTFDGVKPVKKG